MRFKKVCIHF